MPRARSPNREIAEKMWLDSDGSMLLVEIAKQLGLGDTQIRKWKNNDGWDAKLEEKRNGSKSNVTNQNDNAKSNVTKRGAPKKNKNAEGNKGGKGAKKGNDYAVGNAGGGAPLFNKNALTTGQYETILWGDLSDNDVALINLLGDTDPLKQIELQIADLNVRKSRMIRRLIALENGLPESSRLIIKQMQEVKVEETAANGKKVKVPKQQLVVVQEQEQEARKIDDVLQLMKAINDVDTALNKAIQSKHAMEIGNEKLSIDKEKLAIEKAKASGRFDPLAAINKELRDASKRDVGSAWGSRNAQSRQASDGGEV